MKTIVILISLIVSSSIHAQVILDTLYANNKKNVALFFPKPIRQGITGAVSYTHLTLPTNREV